MSIEPLEARRLFAAASAWSDVIDNPFMPLISGMRWIYKGVKEGAPERDVQKVLTHRRLIAGVATTIVSDNTFVNGKLAEKTLDYFAQDIMGNVWYFGEDTAELKPNGQVDNTDGTWRAGVNGAKPGIVMEAHSIKGDFYHQEFAKGVAADQALVLALHQTITVPFGTFNDCLKTQESSPLEPADLEQKYYAPGIGFIKSISIKGESEVLSLVSFVP